MESIYSTFNTVKPYAFFIIEVGVLWFVIYRIHLTLYKINIAPTLMRIYWLVVFFAIAYFAHMSMLLWFFKLLAPGFFIALAIIFQQDLRKALLQSSSFFFKRQTKKPSLDLINAIKTAVDYLSSIRRGALIVLERQMDLESYTENGIILNADASSSLLISIFAYDNPLHDGAVIIHNNQILAASCFLPLSESAEVSSHLGTRHRSALGMSEQTDAVVIIVSEENAAISIASDSKLYYNLTKEEMEKQLYNIYDIAPPILDKNQEDLLVKDLKEKS